MTKMYRTELVKGPLMRISYAHGMFKARAAAAGATEKFGATFVLPKADAAGMKALQAMVAEAVTNEWGEKGIERFKKGLIKNPILDGAGKEAHDKDGNLRAGMGADVVFIRATSINQPKVFNAKVLPATEDECPSGYWGYPVINVFAWHHPQNGDGVSFGVSMFQVVKADEVLGGTGGGNPDDFFEKVDTGAEDDGATAGAGGAGDLFG